MMIEVGKRAGQYAGFALSPYLFCVAGSPSSDFSMHTSGWLFLNVNDFVIPGVLSSSTISASLLEV